MKINTPNDSELDNKIAQLNTSLDNMKIEDEISTI